MNVYQDVDDYMVALKKLSPSDPFFHYKKADFEYQIEKIWTRYRVQMDSVDAKWNSTRMQWTSEQVC